MCMKDSTTLQPKPNPISFSKTSTGALDCHSLLSKVLKRDTLLVFEDRKHFLDCSDCLQEFYETYSANYEAQYPTATAEQLEVIDSINRFYEWQPMLDFENSKSFTSLRQYIENQSNAWLATQSASTFDAEKDPDMQCTILDEATRALYNVNGFIQIGNDIVGVPIFSNPANLASDRFDDCAFLRSREADFDYNNSPLLANRKIAARIEVASGLVESDLKGKIIHYKKVNGGYEKRRANMSIRIAGVGMSGECTTTTDTWLKFEGNKNRRQMTVKNRIWMKWREAYVKENGDLWSISRCSVSFTFDEDAGAGVLFLTR
jgi:hypothetical protein